MNSVILLLHDLHVSLFIKLRRNTWNISISCWQPSLRPSPTMGSKTQNLDFWGGGNFSWLKNGEEFGPKFQSRQNFFGAQFAANKSHMGPHLKQMMSYCPLPQVSGHVSKPRQLKIALLWLHFKWVSFNFFFFSKPEV